MGFSRLEGKQTCTCFLEEPGRPWRAALEQSFVSDFEDSRHNFLLCLWDALLTVRPHSPPSASLIRFASCGCCSWESSVSKSDSKMCGWLLSFSDSWLFPKICVINLLVKLCFPLVWLSTAFFITLKLLLDICVMALADSGLPSLEYTVCFPSEAGWSLSCSQNSELFSSGGLTLFWFKFLACTRVLLSGLFLVAEPKLGLPPWVALVLCAGRVGSVTALCFLFVLPSAELSLFPCSDFLLKTGMNAGALLLCERWTCVFSLLSFDTSKCSCGAWRGQEGFGSRGDPGWKGSAENQPEPCWLTKGSTLWLTAVGCGTKHRAPVGFSKVAWVREALKCFLVVRLGGLTLFSWKDKD